MRKFLSRFRSLPLKTRQLLSLGLILALFVALPLFVWAITTQRFELRKRAQEVVPTPTPVILTNQSSGKSCNQVCQEVGLTCQSIGITVGAEGGIYRKLTSLNICENTLGGTCDTIMENKNHPDEAKPTNLCDWTYCACQPTPSPTATPQLKPTSTPCTATPFPNPCEGQSDGTSCSGGGCGPCVSVCTRPVFFGVCQNQVCTRPTPTPTPLGQWTIKATAICKDTKSATNHVTRLYAWSGDASDLKFRQDLEKGDTPAVGTHTYIWAPSKPYNFVCWGMDDGGAGSGNLKPVCSTTLGPFACANNPYCSEGNYSTQRDENLCNLNHSDNPNLQEKFCYDGIAYEWLEASPAPNGEYTISFQAPDSWCQQQACPNGDKGNLNCDASGLINATDLSILLSKWGPSPCTAQGGHAPADMNGDCKVNSTDLSILLSNWKPD